MRSDLGIIGRKLDRLPPKKGKIILNGIKRKISILKMKKQK